MGNSKKSKAFICIAAFLGIVLVLAAVFYINIKSFTVKRLRSIVGQDVCLMGTFHTDQFTASLEFTISSQL